MPRILSHAGNLDVLFEDNHLLVVNKRSGDIVQGDQTGDRPLSEVVKSFLKEKYNKPGNVYAGVVHRLDRPTSGVLIFAKTSKALSRLNEQFRKSEVKKTYWAISKTTPNPMSGALHHFLKKDASKNRSKAHSKKIDGSKEAKLMYQVIKQINKHNLIEVNPETGRHHQIRVQLSSIGAIIMGDVRYGYQGNVKDNRLYLHARTIEFMHPTKKEPIQITAPVPQDDIWKKVCLD